MFDYATIVDKILFSQMKVRILVKKAVILTFVWSVQHVTLIYDRSACVGGWVANLSYISVELLYYLNGHTKEVSWAAVQMPTFLQLTFFPSLTTRSSPSTHPAGRL